MIPILIYFGICIAFYGALFLDSYIWKLRERRNHAPRHCAELLRARRQRKSIFNHNGAMQHDR